MSVAGSVTLARLPARLAAATVEGQGEATVRLGKTAAPAAGANDCGVTEV
jgi:hypothetical protein